MKSMKKICLTLLALVFVCMGTLSAQQLTAKIGVDPSVRIGKLENGMTYYIKANKKPENRVEFRLAVNAGSNQEDDDQQGLAHFTEHMAFNGMEGFPGNDMVSDLQTIGVIFGRDLNAYTSFDETVYMVKMPTDDQKYIDMGMKILYGWAHGLLLDGKEIDAERGVISEEYRMGLGASDRMRKVWFPVVFTNSRYAERMPIGSIDIIKGFPYDAIRRFYQDWYRPDLQAVIVVGDVNVDAIEAQIKEVFGKIPAKQNGREKVKYGVDNNKEPLVVVCTDKEAMGNQVLLVRKFTHNAMKTVQDYKDYMTRQLYNTMYASRLNELQQNPNTPFVGASGSYGNFIGDIDAYILAGAAKENQIIPTIETLMKEDYRILKHGFLESELQRAKDELLNNYETAEKEADKTESEKFASEYVANFLNQDPIPGVKRELNYANKYLAEITLEDVNALAKQWITEDNFVAVVMAPDKEGVKVPTKEEVLSVITNKALANVEPYVDSYKEQEIVEKSTLHPGTIVSTKELPEIGAKELTLSNGIKVVTKKTDYKNDEILFSAFSKGGYSLYYECDIASLMFAPQMVDRAGIGDLDYSSLEKKLKGKKIGLTPNITPFSEGFDGLSTPKDLETFFQYLNAFFTNPRKDTTTYGLVMNETREQMKMINANPMYKFFGDFLGAVADNDPYQMNMLNYTEDVLSKVDYERAFYLYQERFANPADFTFVFTGNFDEKILAEYLETYVASLPTTDKKEDFKNVFKPFPKESQIKNIYAGADEKSWVGLAFSENIDWNPQNEMMIDVISQALDIELIETIREKMGGVYSPMMQMEAVQYPVSSFITIVMFSCDPNNTDKLSNAVFKILNNFAKKGPKKETLAKVKEQMTRAHESDMLTNKFWGSYIESQLLQGDDLNEVNTFADHLSGVSTKSVAQFMQKYFKTNHYIRVDLYPETTETPVKSTGR